jgi:hypothetical protein
MGGEGALLMTRDGEEHHAPAFKVRARTHKLVLCILQRQACVCCRWTEGHCADCWSLLLQVDVQDTVGCGDSFAAAIALGYSRTHDVAATLLLANAVGAATAMGRGAGTNVADADTVLRLLHRHASSSSSSGGSSGGSSSSSRAVVEGAIDVLRSSLATVEDTGDDSSMLGHSSSSSSSSKAAPAARAA